MITGSPSLRSLDVSQNNIGDDSIFLCLQYINTLTYLNVEQCGLTVEGIVAILYYRASYVHM